MNTKTLGALQKLSKIGKILSKIVAICCIIGAIGCLVGIVSLLTTGFAEYSIGGITLHGLIENSAKISIGTLYAVMNVGLILCIGEAVIAKLAEKYFKNELAAGTPFTFEGAEEMMRLGICIIGVSLGTAIAAPIVYAIINHYHAIVGEMDFNGAAQVGTGIAFIITSLLCKLGAEKDAGNQADLRL